MTSLVILAAGMSRRYGTLKQLAPVGPAGEALLDYAVYDAIRAGMGDIVIVMRSEIAKEIERHFHGMLPDNVAVHLVEQEPPPPGRTKPWGTAHAVLCAARSLNGPFVVVNADDFYGAATYVRAAQFLTDGTGHHAVVGFPIARTLSDQGGVSRARLMIRDGRLTEVCELFDVRQTDSGIVGALANGDPVRLTAADLGSLNCWAMQPSILPALERGFERFLGTRSQNPGAEYYLPDLANAMIRDGEGTFDVLPADATWFGLTFAGDAPRVQRALQALVNDRAYPSPLFGA